MLIGLCLFSLRGVEFKSVQVCVLDCWQEMRDWSASTQVLMGLGLLLTVVFLIIGFLAALLQPHLLWKYDFLISDWGYHMNRCER